MPTNFINLVRRDDNQAPISHTMIGLHIALLVLIVVAICLVGALLFFRQRRRTRKQQEHGLPMYNENRGSTASTNSHRRIMVRPSESIYVYQEKEALMNSSGSPPPSPIPEIRITFPEEVDESGKRVSGRVMMVRVGETSVGLEPVSEKEGLPAYTEDGRFQSLDLDRIGGLVEKAKNNPKQWS